MYTLLRDTSSPTLYAIIHFPTYSWGPSDDGTNWFDSIPKVLYFTFNSDNSFKPKDFDDEVLHMSQFESVEDYCAALCENPFYISPKVVCHFESPDDIFTKFPEVLL